MKPRSILDLPVNVTESIIANMIDGRDLVNLNRASSSLHRLFKKPLYESYKAAESLLAAVMKADTKAVTACLDQLRKIHPKYYWIALLRRTRGTEAHCNRQWQNLSPIGGAMWTGDVHMMLRLLSAMPDEYLPLQLMLSEMQKVVTEGTEHGRLMTPFYDLLTAYQTHHNPRYFVDDRENMVDWSMEQGIGIAQGNLPFYGLQELCRPLDWGPVVFSMTPQIDFSALPEVERSCILSNGVNLLDKNQIKRLGSKAFIKHLSRHQVTFDDIIESRICLFGHWYFEKLIASINNRINQAVNDLAERVKGLSKPALTDSDFEPVNKMLRI